MPDGANTAVRRMAQLPPVVQLRLGAHVLVHAHTQQDTKATARRLLTLLARDHSSYGQIPRTSRRHRWTILDYKTVDQPTLLVPPRPALHPRLHAAPQTASGLGIPQP